jgi:hypothetical protein
MQTMPFRIGRFSRPCLGFECRSNAFQYLARFGDRLGRAFPITPQVLCRVLQPQFQEFVVAVELQWAMGLEDTHCDTQRMRAGFA